MHAVAPTPGEVVPLRGGPVIEIVRVTEPRVHLVVAAAVNGPQFSALQLVYADDRGTGPGTSASAAGAAVSRSSGGTQAGVSARPHLARGDAQAQSGTRPRTR